jgi:segregation and condensation protein B
MELKSILEALLFSSQKPLSSAELRELLTSTAAEAEEETARAFKRVKPGEIDTALEALAAEVAQLGRTYLLVCVAGSWQFVTRQDYAPWLKTLHGVKQRLPRLSQPALETLAIIAYRQPITRAEIEQIRGVSVDGVMQTLLERGLVIATGRAEVVGRPSTYGTTPAFLEYFGLKDLDGLPAAEELRRLPVEKPASLLTVDPGLATAPPGELNLASAETEARAPGENAPAQAPTVPERPPDSPESHHEHR